jgi:hypothetical protein
MNAQQLIKLKIVRTFIFFFLALLSVTSGLILFTNGYYTAGTSQYILTILVLIYMEIAK